jgi:hypothetical protein
MISVTALYLCAKARRRRNDVSLEMFTGSLTAVLSVSVRHVYNMTYNSGIVSHRII